MTAPAEGPATVTPSLTEREAAEQMKRTRGIVAGWQGLSEGPATVTPYATCGHCGSKVREHESGCPVRPATVTLTDEVDRIARLLMAEWKRVEEKPVTVSYVATFADMARVVIADTATRVAALTADLAAANDDFMASTGATMRALDERDEAERVIANVRALHGGTHWCTDAQEQPYVYESGVLWPCPTLALLPAAPTGEGKTDG